MPLMQQIATGPAANAGPDLPHVLFIVDGFPQSLGGGERVVLRLASLLPRFGFRASILTFTVHPQSPFRPEAAPCPVYLLPLTKTYGAAAWRGAWELRRLLKQQRITIVQTFFESSDIWGGAVTRALSSAKLIWSRRDMGILRSPKHERAYRTMRRLPHAVMAVSQKVADHVIAQDKVPAERVYVVYNGLEIAPSTRATSPDPNHPVIATIGNVRHVKGHDVLIEAAAMVVEKIPGARFVVAGEVLEQPYFDTLKQRIETLGLQEHFRFAGGVADLGAFLSQADAFVLPSRSEGFSNALVEAMACALPVIATDVGGNAEAAVSEESGLIVPPENSEDLAGAMLRVLQDRQLAFRLGSAARQRAADLFTSDAMLRRTTQIYRNLLAAVTM